MFPRLRFFFEPSLTSHFSWLCLLSNYFRGQFSFSGMVFGGFRTSVWLWYKWLLCLPFGTECRVGGMTEPSIFGRTKWAAPLFCPILRFQSFFFPPPQFFFLVLHVHCFSSMVQVFPWVPTGRIRGQTQLGLGNSRL